MLQLELRFYIISPVVQSSIHILQSWGYKVTRPRREVLEVLLRARRPLSPYDIQRRLKKQGKRLNHVTIYRTLDLFCSLNLAHKLLSTGGFVKCTLGDKEGCHRFMVCQRCGATREFADRELCSQESKSTGNLGFHAECHLSESSGLCSHCYARQLLKQKKSPPTRETKNA